MASPEAEAERRMARIRAVVREIPEGSVASYGQIAVLAGLPRGARQVGRALGQLPEGSSVPWHRVVRSSGTLAFAAGHPSRALQVARLMEEDVPVVRGRVDMSRYRWRPLDELLWKPSAAWDRSED